MKINRMETAEVEMIKKIQATQFDDEFGVGNFNF